MKTQPNKLLGSLLLAFEHWVSVIDLNCYMIVLGISYSGMKVYDIGTWFQPPSQESCTPQHPGSSFIKCFMFVIYRCL